MKTYKITQLDNDFFILETVAGTKGYIVFDNLLKDLVVEIDGASPEHRYVAVFKEATYIEKVKNAVKALDASEEAKKKAGGA